jgi:hypothetical protein
MWLSARRLQCALRPAVIAAGRTHRAAVDGFTSANDAAARREPDGRIHHRAGSFPKPPNGKIRNQWEK